MKPAWAIAPYKNEKLWEEIWQFDRANNVIAIGWSDLGNVVALNEDQIREKIKTEYPEYKPRRISYIIGLSFPRKGGQGRKWFMVVSFS